MLWSVFIFTVIFASFHIGRLIGMSKIVQSLRNDTLRYDSNEDEYFISIDEELDESSESEMKIYIERENDIIFAYCEDTNKFLAMGKTTEELEGNLNGRFPGMSFFCTEENLEMLELI